MSTHSDIRDTAPYDICDTPCGWRIVERVCPDEHTVMFVVDLYMLGIHQRRVQGRWYLVEFGCNGVDTISCKLQPSNPNPPVFNGTWRNSWWFAGDGKVFLCQNYANEFTYGRDSTKFLWCKWAIEDDGPYIHLRNYMLPVLYQPDEEFFGPQPVRHGRRIIQQPIGITLSDSDVD
jgi:hypothetical protein